MPSPRTVYLCLLSLCLFSAFASAGPARVVQNQDAQSVLRQDGLEELQSWAQDVKEPAVRECSLRLRASYSTSPIPHFQPDCICIGSSSPFKAWQAGVEDPLSCDDTYETLWDISTPANTTYHTVYHPLNEIEEFIWDLANVHPDIVQLQYIGHSAEGREMIAMKLSKPNPNVANEDDYASNAKKAGFVITGAQHSREVRIISCNHHPAIQLKLARRRSQWIATSTTLYLAHSLVTDAAEAFALSSWLEHFVSPYPSPYSGFLGACSRTSE